MTDLVTSARPFEDPHFFSKHFVPAGTTLIFEHGVPPEAAEAAREHFSNTGELLDGARLTVQSVNSREVPKVLSEKNGNVYIPRIYDSVESLGTKAAPYYKESDLLEAYNNTKNNAPTPQIVNNHIGGVNPSDYWAGAQRNRNIPGFMSSDTDDGWTKTALKEVWNATADTGRAFGTGALDIAGMFDGLPLVGDLAAKAGDMGEDGWNQLSERESRNGLDTLEREGTAWAGWLAPQLAGGVKFAGALAKGAKAGAEALSTAEKGAEIAKWLRNFAGIAESPARSVYSTGLPVSLGGRVGHGAVLGATMGGLQGVTDKDLDVLPGVGGGAAAGAAFPAVGGLVRGVTSRVAPLASKALGLTGPGKNTGVDSKAVFKSVIDALEEKHGAKVADLAGVSVPNQPDNDLSKALLTGPENLELRGKALTDGQKALLADLQNTTKHGLFNGRGAGDPRVERIKNAMEPVIAEDMDRKLFSEISGEFQEDLADDADEATRKIWDQAKETQVSAEEITEAIKRANGTKPAIESLASDADRFVAKGGDKASDRLKKAILGSKDKSGSVDVQTLKNMADSLVKSGDNASHRKMAKSVGEIDGLSAANQKTVTAHEKSNKAKLRDELTRSVAPELSAQKTVDIVDAFKKVIGTIREQKFMPAANKGQIKGDVTSYVKNSAQKKLDTISGNNVPEAVKNLLGRAMDGEDNVVGYDDLIKLVGSVTEDEFKETLAKLSPKEQGLIGEWIQGLYKKYGKPRDNAYRGFMHGGSSLVDNIVNDKKDDEDDNW